MQKAPIWMYVLVVLVVVGLISSLVNNPGALIIPLIIFGIVFWLLRYPGAGFSFQKLFKGKMNTWFQNRSSSYKTKNTNSKRPNLYVLKRKPSDQNDEPPKFH